MVSPRVKALHERADMVVKLSDVEPGLGRAEIEQGEQLVSNK